MTACHKIIFYTYQIVVIYSIPDGQAIMWYPFRISDLASVKIHWDDSSFGKTTDNVIGGCQVK